MTMDTVDKFTRPPLDDPSQQIRLLSVLRPESDLHQSDNPKSRRDSAHSDVLEPWRGSTKSDDIRCTLTSHWLDNVRDQYTAVSYTWGPKAPTRTIYVNDQAIRVRYNCWYALSQLLLHKVDGWIWIDAICIDQESHGEKGEQVMLMGQVYAQAHTVAACIGGSGDDKDLFNNVPQGRLNSGHLVDRSVAWILCDRSYFNRVWTVQECLLASKLEAYCGRLRIDWRVLVARVSRAAKADDKIRATLFTKRADMKYPQASESSTEVLDLAEAVLQYSHRECHEPRDKLYSLLSLVPQHVRDRVHVNYTVPLLEVLVSYANAYDVLEGDCLFKMIRGMRRLSLDFALQDEHFGDQLRNFLGHSFQARYIARFGIYDTCINNPRLSTVRIRLRVHHITRMAEWDQAEPTSSQILPLEPKDTPSKLRATYHLRAAKVLNPYGLLSRPRAHREQSLGIPEDLRVLLSETTETALPPAEMHSSTGLLDSGNKPASTKLTCKDDIAVIETGDSGVSLQQFFQAATKSEINIIYRNIDEHGNCKILGSTVLPTNHHYLKSSTDRFCEVEVRPETLLALALVTESDVQFLNGLVTTGSSRMRLVTR